MPARSLCQTHASPPVVHSDPRGVSTATLVAVAPSVPTLSTLDTRVITTNPPLPGAVQTVTRFYAGARLAVPAAEAV
jgi:hypothetical protein